MNEKKIYNYPKINFKEFLFNQQKIIENPFINYNNNNNNINK